MSRFTLSILFVFAAITLSGQNLSVTFSGTGAANQIDQVTATNLKTNQSVTLPGNETLVLTANTGISDLDEPASIGLVFPNPFSGRATLRMSALTGQPACLKIQNLMGQVVAQLNSTVEPGENEFAIALNAAGIYVVSITTAEGTAGYKVISTGSNSAESSFQYLGSGSGNPGRSSEPVLKSSETTYSLGYSSGDIILYRCQSGFFTTIVTDSPVSSKNYLVEFVECADADGKNYSVVKTGSQTWMAGNLAYLPSVSAPTAGSETIPSYYVYGYEGRSVNAAKSTANYSTYGVLYNWEAARMACPGGWHLPTDAEWTQLMDYLGASAGGKLKETGTEHWSSPNYGATNSSGFSALPGGDRTNTGAFANLGYNGYLWSSSENTGLYAWSRVVPYEDDGINPMSYYRSGGFSVRCILGAGTPAVLAVVTTADVSSIGETTASCGGEVTSDGGAAVTERGVCWNTGGAPTTNNTKTTDGPGTGSFESALTGLSAGTPYYVRAYATNSAGTAYGNEIQFTTGQSVALPTVTTDDISAIAETTATGGGNVTADGGAAVTARGVCWNTGGTPIIAGSKTTDGSGTGSFPSSLTGLTAGTPYYVRAYATNSAGTAYGTEKQFTTGQPVALPTVTTADITAIAETTATGGGNVTADGGAAVTTRGVCWNTGGSPTVSNSNTTDGSGTGSFTSSLSGLAANTPYYVRAYATNRAGTAYGTEKQFTTTGGGGGDCPLVLDGHTYNCVTIGTQIWMDENLAYLPAVTPSSNGSDISPLYYVYGYEGVNVGEAKASTNFATYGVLYNWEAAKIACPPGWHLPSDDEWKILEKYLGMSDSDADTKGSRMSGTVGGKLKETGTNHWLGSNVAATNTSGFTALPGGFRNNNLGFSSIGYYGYFWTATENGASAAWSRAMDTGFIGVHRNDYPRSYSLSVRCIKN